MTSAFRRLTVALFALPCLGAGSLHAAEGLVSLKSAHSAKETIDRFERAAKAKGLTVFLRIDHAAGAQKVGKALRPTELLIFGSPRAGTPLLECAQSVGIDLPLKALAWQDDAGHVWLGYNDVSYLARRHGIDRCGEAVERINGNVETLARESVQ